MKIHYFQIVKDSTKFTLKHKLIWIFGFLLSFFGLKNIDILNEYQMSIKNNQNVPNLIQEIRNSTIDIKRAEFYRILSFIYMILIISIFWYLSCVSKILIIKAVRLYKLKGDQKVNLEKLWKESNHYLLKFLLLDIYKLYAVLPIFIIFIIASIIANLYPWLGAFVFSISLLIVFFIILVAKAIWDLAERIVIYYKKSSSDSLEDAWDVLKKFTSEYILALFVFLLFMTGYSLAQAIFNLIVSVPIINLFLSSITYGTTSGLILQIGAAGFLLLILLSLFQSPFQVFITTYWSNYILVLESLLRKDKNVTVN